MNKLLDKYIPWKKLTKNEYKRKFKPWITDGILTKIKQRNKMFQKYANCKDDTKKAQLKNEYKLIKNEITYLTRKGKKEHYDRYFTENKANLKKIWKGIKEVINIKSKTLNHPTCIKKDERTIYEPTEIANTLTIFLMLQITF